MKFIIKIKYQFSFSDSVISLSGQDLVVIYDPPHLIKGIRNIFLTKNIENDGKISK